MDVRVLGCSGGIGGLDQLTTALLVDQDILIDCGTGASVLSVEELIRIDHIFVTHSHLDHIALIPMLVDTVCEHRSRPIILHASAETLRILRAHIFNWLVWPDFNAIPERDRPFLIYNEIRVGESVNLGNRKITAIPALHTVPAVGYCLSTPEQSLVFTGDTTVCPQMIEAINSVENLRYLLIETAFANQHHDLALAARHLCPDTLAKVLDQLRGRPEICISHLKPTHGERIFEQIAEFAGDRVIRALANGDQFTI